MDPLAAHIIETAPAGSTVTMQLDLAGNVLSWYVRSPDPAARVLAQLPQRAYWLNGKSVTKITPPPEGFHGGGDEH